MPKTITAEKTTGADDRPAKSRKAGSSRSKNSRAARRALRLAYRTRRGMAPLYATAAQAVAGSALAQADDGWKTALAATVTGAAATAAWGRWDARIGKKRLRKRLPARADFIAAASAVTTGGGLVTAMAATGGLQLGDSPYPALAAAWGVGHGIYWWRRGKTTAAPEPALSRQMQLWLDDVACSDGPLPGSELKNVVTTDYGWTGVIVVRKGNWRKAYAAAADIAGALDLPEEMLQIE
jgi:hypothetical protein